MISENGLSGATPSATALVKKLVELLRGWDCVYRDKETPEDELGEARIALWMATIKALTEGQAWLERQGKCGEGELFNAEDWHEEIGAVLWWNFPIEEPAYCGTPLDTDFPQYKTHWTRLVIPSPPTTSQQEARK